MTLLNNSFQMNLSRALPLLLPLLWAGSALAVPVRLRVVNEAGAPIADAQISYLDYANDEKARPTPARTAADGTLSLDLKGEAKIVTNVNGSSYILVDSQLGGARVQARGYGVRNLTLVPGENVVTLRDPALLRGVVKDAAGAPIAGASVQLTGVEKDQGFTHAALVTNAKLGPLTVSTRGDGSWEMTGLAQGYAHLRVSAPGAATTGAEFWIQGGDNAAPPLALNPAGTLIGRVLDRDDQPLAGVEVKFSDDDAGAQSDAQGRFTLKNVPTGDGSLTFFRPTADWLGAGDVEFTIKAQGDTVSVGDVKMGQGMLLSGTIRDQTSGAVLPNFGLRVGNKTFQTDAAGHFESRVNNRYPWLQITGDYLATKNLPSVPDSAEKFDLGEITVERTTTLPLDLRDESGRAVPQARVQFQSQARDQPGVVLQREAVFDGQNAQITGLPAGAYQVTGTDLWAVIEPQTATIALPAVGKALPPLTIRVREFAPTRVSGRIVDGAGQPVARARVKVHLTKEWRGASAFSGADGTWNLKIPSAAGEPMLDEVKLETRVLVRGGEMTRVGEAKENVWHSADIVMARTDLPLTGRVTDDKGAPVVGARVSWPGAPNLEFVASDKNGQFEIRGVPAAPLSVRASDGRSVAETTATPGTPVELKLPPATAPLSEQEVEKLWEQLPIEHVYDLNFYFEALGARRVYEVARRLDAGKDPAQIGDGLSDYLSQRARLARTPAQREDTAREGVELLRGFKFSAGRFNFSQGDSSAAVIAVLAAQTGDAELRAWAAAWVDAQKPRVVVDSKNEYDIWPTLRMALVGAALGRADAQTYRDIALLQIERYRGEYRDQYLPDWGALLWNGDPKGFDDAIAAWSPLDQRGAIMGALKVVTELAPARALLARLEKLTDDPAVIAADGANANADFPPRAGVLYRGRINFARSMALVDAPAALDALDKVRDAVDSGEVYQIAATIARAALAQNQSDLARRALRLGLRDGYGDGYGASMLALEARPFDPDLARQLLDKARQNVRSSGNFLYPGSLDAESYALALHDFDAGAGRLLLEDQWALWLQMPASPQASHPRDDRARAQEKLARAMAVYDVPRALQWLGEIKDDRDQTNNGLAATRLSILATALAPPTRRALILN